MLTNHQRGSPQTFAFLLIILLLTVDVYAGFNHQLHGKKVADFVIVGGGTAGCVVTARLCTALPHKSFILLERGRPLNASENLLRRSPRLQFSAVGTPATSETFFAVDQPGILNRTTLLFAGRSLGGMSNINGMQWVLPRPGSVDSWDIQGLTTASSKRFFRRALRTIGARVPPPDLRHRYINQAIRASRQAGFGPSEGALDDARRRPRQMYPNVIAADRRGRRVDSCTAYLRFARRNCRHNLRVVQDATVTRVQIVRRRARGVHVAVTSAPTKRNFIRARDEVVLSAGPFHSPALLMRSGVGPDGVLQRAGVPVLKDLPVGTRTQGRCGAGYDMVYTAPKDSGNDVDRVNSETERKRYLSGKSSPLGKSIALTSGRDGSRAYLAITAVLISFTRPVQYQIPALAAYCISNPLSFGTLRIVDRDPFKPPEVDLALLRDRRDVRQQRACLRKLLRISRGLQLSINATVTKPVDGRFTERYVRQNSIWSGHYVGGSAVGSVLKGRFKVRGITGLRVIDASAIPKIPISAGPLASVYMVREYGSELISREYRRVFAQVFVWFRQFLVMYRSYGDHSKR